MAPTRTPRHAPSSSKIPTAGSKVAMKQNTNTNVTRSRRKVTSPLENTPGTPGWTSGGDALFELPKESSPFKNRRMTRRSSMYLKAPQMHLFQTAISLSEEVVFPVPAPRRKQQLKNKVHKSPSPTKQGKSKIVKVTSKSVRITRARKQIDSEDEVKISPKNLKSSLNKRDKISPTQRKTKMSLKESPLPKMKTSKDDKISPLKRKAELPVKDSPSPKKVPTRRNKTLPDESKPVSEKKISKSGKKDISGMSPSVGKTPETSLVEVNRKSSLLQKEGVHTANSPKQKLKRRSVVNTIQSPELKQIYSPQVKKTPASSKVVYPGSGKKNVTLDNSTSRIMSNQAHRQSSRHSTKKAIGAFYTSPVNESVQLLHTHHAESLKQNVSRADLKSPVMEKSTSTKTPSRRRIKNISLLSSPVEILSFKTPKSMLKKTPRSTGKKKTPKSMKKKTPMSTRRSSLRNIDGQKTTKPRKVTPARPVQLINRSKLINIVSQEAESPRTSTPVTVSISRKRVSVPHPPVSEIHKPKRGRGIYEGSMSNAQVTAMGDSMIVKDLTDVLYENSLTEEKQEINNIAPKADSGWWGWCTIL